MTDTPPSPDQRDEIAARLAGAQMEPSPPKRGLNAWMLATFGMGPIALLIVLSERGEGLINTLRQIPGLVSEWTEGSPLGAWTVAAAILLPALVVIRLNALLGPWTNKHTKEVMLDLLGIGGAFAVAYYLNPTVPGALIGIGSATLVSTTERWLRAIFRLVERLRLRIDPEE